MTKSYRRKNRIAGQFAPRTIDMLRSPAYRALSRGGHQVLARIEIELADHGGMDNGKLPVTFDQFEAYGVHRHAIAPAVRELVALGFIEVTEQGRAGNADWRRPTKFRITYRYVERASPTDEWRRITDDDACSIARDARHLEDSLPRSKKQKTSDGKRTTSQCGKRTKKPRFHSAETVTTGHSAETVTTLDTIGVVVGDAAGNLVSEEHAPASDQANGGCTDQANGGCSAVPDPWADLDIPAILRR
jgi:hypothetical protein